MKLCVIYNFAAHYRQSIFVKMDQTYDCDWYFGKRNADIKKMDYSLLKGNVKEVQTRHIFGLSYQKGVVRLLREPYTDYILLGDTHSISTWLFCINARLLHPKKKLYFWSHGWYGKETRTERIIKNVLFKLPNGGTFLYGNYARNLMIKEGFNPNKLFVIHNSLAYDEQAATRQQLTVNPFYQEHFNNDFPNLFFVGRLTSVKKLDMILKAMRQLEDKGRHYNLTFVGGGEKKEELESLTRELKLEKRVWFYGPCYDEKSLGEMIYNADLCVSPGNVGLTAIHTMMFGTPVLTHDDFPHQMPEFEAIREGITGAFFKYGDTDALAEVIARWFDKNGDKREEIRQACMKEIDEHWTPQFQIEVLKQHLL